MFDELDILPVPDDPRWMARLEQDNAVWLVKQGQVAWVAEPFAFRPGDMTGSIHVDMGHGSVQRWFVRPDGTGFDRKQLIQPMADNLPESPSPGRLAAIEGEVSRLKGELDAFLWTLKSLRIKPGDRWDDI
jgi:hypothetical protein